MSIKWRNVTNCDKQHQLILFRKLALIFVRTN